MALLSKELEDVRLHRSKTVLEEMLVGLQILYEKGLNHIGIKGSATIVSSAEESFVQLTLP